MFWCAPDTEQAEILAGNFSIDCWKQGNQMEMSEGLQQRILEGQERLKDPETEREMKKVGNKASKLL